jgi:MFS family permease
MRTVESARDRRRLARDAGFGQTSFPSILAGTLVAFGAVATALAIAGAVGANAGLTTDGISTHEWRQAGIAGAVIATVVVFLAFFFGGYTAGRMGRRSGMRNGLGVFVLAAAVIAVVVGLTAWLGDADSVRQRLSDNGVPTGANTWSDIGIGAAIAAGAAMLLGSLLGGTKGEGWHGRLVTAAVEKRDERAKAEEAPRPRHALGQDETSIDLRAGDPTVVEEPSIEEERENQRIARSDVGM